MHSRCNHCLTAYVLITLSETPGLTVPGNRNGIYLSLITSNKTIHKTTNKQVSDYPYSARGDNVMIKCHYRGVVVAVPYLDLVWFGLLYAYLISEAL